MFRPKAPSKSVVPLSSKSYPSSSQAPSSLPHGAVKEKANFFQFYFSGKKERTSLQTLHKGGPDNLLLKAVTEPHSEDLQRIIIGKVNGWPVFDRSGSSVEYLFDFLRTGFIPDLHTAEYQKFMIEADFFRVKFEPPLLSSTLASDQLQVERDPLSDDQTDGRPLFSSLPIVSYGTIYLDRSASSSSSQTVASFSPSQSIACQVVMEYLLLAMEGQCCFQELQQSTFSAGKTRSGSILFYEKETGRLKEELPAVLKSIQELSLNGILLFDFFP